MPGVHCYTDTVWCIYTVKNGQHIDSYFVTAVEQIIVTGETEAFMVRLRSSKTTETELE